MNNKIVSTFKQAKTKIKSTKKRTLSSNNWLERQLNDPYVALAKKNGYRSRASFKIIEINEKFKLFKSGFKILDLGSAPGGWSQIAVSKVGKNNVLAVDILDMEPIEGVKFIKQDFLAPEAEKIILNEMNGEKYDVIISDMAANTTGNKQIDHLRTASLVEEAYNFAIKVLKDGGSFVSKIFQGGTEPKLFNEMKKSFKIVKHFKPNSSRKESVEMYVIAKNFNKKN